SSSPSTMVQSAFRVSTNNSQLVMKSAMPGFFACNTPLPYSHSMTNLKNTYWLHSTFRQKESDRLTREKFDSLNGQLLFRISRYGDRAREREQTYAFVILQRKQEVCFLAMHQAQAEKRFFPALLLVVPHRIDDLDLVQLSNRQYVIAKIRIADDHVEQHVAGGEQDEIEPSLILVPFRQKLVDMAQRDFAVAKSSADLIFQFRVIDLQGLFIKPRRCSSGIVRLVKNLISRHQTCHL